jgi:hypothetical protein
MPTLISKSAPSFFVSLAYTLFHQIFRLPHGIGVFAMKSVKGLAAFVLVLGGAAVCFLTFAVAFSFLFTLFARPPVLNQIIGYSSLAGPLPLLAGTVLLFPHRTQKLGARLTVAGCFVLSVYMVVCYARLDVYSVGLWDRLFWFGLIPVAVLAADYASYRIYLLLKAQAA